MNSLIQEVKENPMLKIKVEKVVVNIGVGKSGEPLEKAKAVLSLITGVKKVSERKAKKTIKEYGIRKKEPIAAVVTLRGSSAKEFLNKAFNAIGKKIKFDSISGRTLSFGIKEHILLPGVKYDPMYGIFGMDVSVTFGRPGYRVLYRRRRRSKIGKSARINEEDVSKYLSEEFGVEVIK
ncbi:MAG: 50S ribosomal protein L5 [Candidatus Brockarchaeota archaeon]|nr:50S ribosomal protein L5 [Candidatus Brockarchaeota archaeon]